MNRRLLLGAGVGVAAAAAGLGAAVWREKRPVDAADVMAQRFERPGGGEVRLASYRGGPLLLNFWATWCPPCVQEMPLLDRFQREHGAAGWHVVGLAVDRDATVREFLARHSIAFTNALAGPAGLELARALGNDTGGLPFSVAFRAHAAQPFVRKAGALDEATLVRWVAQAG